MKKRLVSVLLVMALLVPTVTACHDSSKDSQATKDVQATGYDPEEAAKKFDFGELSDEDKNYTIEMGYNNCDHMVGAIIGEKAGIYKALGLNVNVTKSGETLKALTSGAMDVGYTGIEGAIRAVNQGAPFSMAAANHMGGSRYLVVSNDITEPSQLVGKTISMTAEPEINPEWLTWSEKLGIPADASSYNIVSMGGQDAMFALKAGQIDAFTCCDPYASIAEFEGFGHIMGTAGMELMSTLTPLLIHGDFAVSMLCPMTSKRNTQSLQDVLCTLMRWLLNTCTHIHTMQL